MFKRITLWLCTSLFSLASFGFIISLSATLLLRPQPVKSWVEKSGAYDSLPSALVTEASKKQATESGGSDDMNFSDPVVQAAAKEALSPDFLRSSTRQVIDGTFSWLNGSVAKPTFSIDVGSQKQVFADSLAAKLLERYEALPACAANTLPKSTDPFTIDCRPAAGFDAQTVIDEQKQELLSNKDFLPEATINADSIGKESSGQSFFEKDKNAPKAYQATRMLPLAFLGVMALTGLGIVFLSQSKKLGLRKIGWRLAIIGGLFLLITIVSYFGTSKLHDVVGKQGEEAMATIYKDLLIRGIDAVRLDALKFEALAAGGLFVIGVGLLILTRGAKNAAEKNDKKPKESKPEPEAPKAPEEPVKPVANSAPAPTPSAPEVAKRPATPRPKRTLIQ